MLVKPFLTEKRGTVGSNEYRRRPTDAENSNERENEREV